MNLSCNFAMALQGKREAVYPCAKYFSEELSVAQCLSQSGDDSSIPNPRASLRNALGSRRFSQQCRTDIPEPNHPEKDTDPSQASLVLHSRRLQSWQEMIQDQGWPERAWRFCLCMRWQRTCITDLPWIDYFPRYCELRHMFCVVYFCHLCLRRSSTLEYKYTTCLLLPCYI